MKLSAACTLLGVLACAAPALGTVQDSARELGVTARGSHYGRAQSAVRGLVRKGPGGVNGLIGALDSPHVAIRIEALRGLVKIGAHAVVALPAVADLVEYQDAAHDLPLAFAGAHLEARLAAERVQLDEPGGLSLDSDRRPRRKKPPRFADARGALRTEALHTLARLGAYDPQQLLLAIARVPEPGGLSPAAWSDTRLLFGLSLKDRPDAVPLVRAALASEDESTRACGLGAVPWLKHEANEVKANARACLDSESPGLRLRALALVPSLTFTCAEIRPRLAAALADKQLDARLLAAGSLLRVCGPDETATAVALEGLSERPRPKPTRTILAAIDATSSLEALPEAHARALIALLDHKRPEIRARCARCLGTFGPAAKRAVVALKRKLKDREPMVRKAAAEALRRID